MNSRIILIRRIFILAVIVVCGMVMIPSGEQSTLPAFGPTITERNINSDIIRINTNISDNINQKVFDLPKVYTLPMDQSVPPKPDESCFAEDTYEDPTIKVKCWHERIEINGRTVTANFADVTIAHPTQLRSAFAGGQYGNKRVFGRKIAAMFNAVVAINADFYNYRPDGLLIRNATFFREIPYGADILFIDSDGNFSIKSDYEAVKEGYYKEKKIYQSFSFGPALIIDGKKLKKFRSKDSCNPNGNEPRTAIGQLGTLHYLLCTVDGRMRNSNGITMPELSDIMESKNCITAYNMDGGQSSILYFHNGLFNKVADGGERAISDILYFSTAIPESERN